MKKKVLLDLWHAIAHQHGGLAQENSLMFKIFSTMNDIEVSGMLHTAGEQYSFKKNKYKQNANAYDKNLIQTNLFFLSILNKVFTRTKYPAMQKIYDFVYAYFNKGHALFPIDKKFNNVIWRNFLKRSLMSEERRHFVDKLFLFSNAIYKYNSYINTSQYDFIVFPGPMPIRVSPNTIKIIRYHDVIPILGPDVLPNLAKQHYHEVLSCRKDSFFVCNSEPTRESFLSIFPDLEQKAFTIPCALPDYYKRVLDEKTLQRILINRLSNFLLNDHEITSIRKMIKENGHFNYILALATLEPRKNYVSLIKAWEKLNNRNEVQIKLIIVGAKGWITSETEHAMKPHVKNGEIIHLTNLTPEEIPYLYSHAKLFVSASYDEGFGFPPMEAMQCGCPTLISDIPAHRWVSGNASFYCDPYNINSIADAIEQLIYSKEADQLCINLVSKGYQRVRRYGIDEVKNQWSELFNQLKH